MAPTSQDSSSNRASHNYRFTRRGHNSRNRRTSHGTEHSHAHMRRRIHRSGYLPHFSFKFNGTIHIHTRIAMMNAESFSLPPANGSFVMSTHVARPQDLRTSVGGVQTPAAGRGSSRAGCHRQTQNAGHTYVPGHDNTTPGVPTPAVGLGPAGSSGVGNDQPTPNATSGFAGQTSQGPKYVTQAAAPPAVGLGLNNDGFTSGAQMDAVRPGSVTGVQTPVFGLGPAGSSVVGYNQPYPFDTLGFAGLTLQAPFVPEYDTQAAAPPPTLDQLLVSPSWATAVNNAFAENFLLPAPFDNFMDMLGPRF